MTRSPFLPRRLDRTGRALRRAAARWSFVEDEVAGLDAWVSPGDVCLDIGAEYGLYTFALAALVGPAGHVHSVEPLPGPARWLSTGAAVLGCRNVTVHRTALGAHARAHAALSLPRRRGLPVHGRAYLTTGATGPGPNTEFRTARRVPTRVRTVDGLCRDEGIEKVHFVKADVEGAEAAVLAGARDTLLRHRPTLLLELEDRHLAKYAARADELVSALRESGYTMRCRRADRWDAVDEVTEDCRNYLFHR